jgi:RNA polymerase subunit RPABC4/transcription elongation factor Spt4
MAKRIQVCRNCKTFTTEKVCPNCKSTNLSTSWKGLVIILNTNSEIAKRLNISKEGKYALYVG